MANFTLSLNYVTGGLSGVPSYVPLVAGGNGSAINPTQVLNPGENPHPPLPPTGPAAAGDLQSIVALRNLNGQSIISTPTGGLTVQGTGYNINFDPTTLQGRITPLINPYTSLGVNASNPGTISTFTGSNVLLIIEVSEPQPGAKRYYKQLIEATTITVSVHREIAPVRASGYINPKGFALGTRTIAGTLILDQFTVDALLPFFQASLVTDTSKDTNFVHPDQLPPFNITLLFTNEEGYASMRHLLDVKFVTDGVVYSIQDMLSEQTLSWMALDFTPLQPLTSLNIFQPVNPQDQTLTNQNSPTTMMQQPSSLTSVN